MARFLTTSATNYFVEELIRDAQQQVVLISPFLRFNDRIRELLEDKNRLKLDVRIVFGKSELGPQETNWLRSLEFVRTSFCQNLHAKCYLNEKAAIITSMNLYEFSQVNNNEMGVLIDRDQDPDLYKDTREEAERLIRISEHVRLAAEPVEENDVRPAPVEPAAENKTADYDKLTTSKLAKALGLRTAELNDRLVARGLLVKVGEDFKLTDAGQAVGGERRVSKRFGPYFLWPKDLQT